MIKNVNHVNGEIVQTRIFTVSELAMQLQSMIAAGHGDLPVFSSDVRGRYPFATVVPYTNSGYPDCLLIQPQPHLHAAPRALHGKGDSYISFVNDEADRIRAACGAFA